MTTPAPPAQAPATPQPPTVIRPGSAPVSVTTVGVAPQPPVPTPPTQVVDKGFPENTPVAEMTDKQGAAYWKFYARKHEDAAKEVPDLKAKATAWEKHQAESATDADRAIAAARAEGETAATEKANTKAALTILRAGLSARGKDEAAVNDLIAAANPAAFITEGDVDTDKVARYLEQIAGPVMGMARPDMGQGRRQTSGSSGVNAGRALFEDVRGKKSA